ncbi:MAG: hypothetical protein ACKPJD_38520, partial [Planctomycetaceae bacterium]
MKSSAKPTNTRTASLTREIASPGEDLEQVEEWLSSPVSAPVPPQSSRSQIRRSSYADPFVDADGEGDAGAASGAGEMAEEELEEADESAADLETGGEPELAAEDDLAAEMESTEDSESAADAEFSMEYEAVSEREAVRQPQPRSRRAAEVPAVGAGAAGPAGSRVRAATDGFEWQSGSKPGSKPAALKSSAKPTNT